MTVIDVDPQHVIDDLRDELAELEGHNSTLADEVRDALNETKALAGELHDLNTRARLAGHFNADGAMAWIEDDDDPLNTIAKWHDEAHNGSRKFCDEEPCRSLIREGWSLSD